VKHAAQDVPIADKVAALREPASYPEPTRAVSAIETHMSWVFLTDAHAYKLKKPMRYDHLDFSAASTRHFYCLEELRLNRRLAPAVYLDVVPLVLTPAGRLQVDGAGSTVDWLVKMRRLGADSVLDTLLQRGVATPAQMRAVAARLCRFFLAQPPAPLSAPAYRALLLREIDESERGLCDPAWGLPAARIHGLCRQQREVLRGAADLFGARVAAGRVIEGHGDLRPEHIYLGEPLAVIDCLEFSSELRTLDSADEIGFLALECERAGANALGLELLRAYRECCGDAVPPALVHFHQSCRACTRARLAIWHLREPQYRDSPKWRGRARQYLALALRHLRACLASLPAAR
jgi:aminoglycoside phosphotransferase family enzyme